MAREDLFDKDLAPLTWFDHCERVEAWFDDDLITPPVLAGNTVIGSVVNDEGIVAASVAPVAVTIAVTGSVINDEGIVVATVAPAISASSSIINDEGIVSATVSATSVATLTGSVVEDDGIVSASVVPAIRVVSAIANDEGVVQAAVVTVIGVAGQVINDDGVVLSSVTPLAAGINVSGSIINDDGEVSADVTVTGTPIVVVKSKGAGKKSNKKALTYAERKELDKKVYDALFNIAEEIAVKSDIDKSYVTDNLVTDIVSNIDNRDSIYTHRAVVSDVFLEESARLQTVLILEKLREAQEEDDIESLMLLL